MPPAPHGPGRKEWDNPCYTLPYEPRNADERDCLASWQQLEIAVMHHEPEVWAQHVADEFMVVGAARRHTKADRKAVIEEQQRTNANSAPAPLVSARLFGFKDAMVMACEHQPFHGKAARVSRVFIKRDGRWLMAVSFQTTRQDAADENDLKWKHHDPPQHTARFLHRFRRGRTGDRLRPARDRHRTHRRLGHSVSRQRRRKTESGRREHRRAAGEFGGRRGRAKPT